MSVTNIAGPDHVGEAEARLGERRLDDREGAAGLGADVARMARPAVGAGVGRAGDPAALADDDRPAVAGGRLPRPARRDASRRPVTRGSVAPGEDLRVAPRSPAAARPAASSAARSTRPSRYSAGEWSLPPIGPSPSRLGTPMPGGRVGVGRAARGGVVDLEAERVRDGLGVLDEPAAPLRASPSATSAPSPRTRPSCPGPRSPRRCARISASAVSSASRVDRPDVDLERAALGDDVRARPAARSRRR